MQFGQEWGAIPVLIECDFPHGYTVNLEAEMAGVCPRLLTVCKEMSGT